MLHPHTQLRYQRIDMGYGIVATRFIPRGTITWALDPLDRVLPDGPTMALPEVYAPVLEKFTFCVGERRVLCWDTAKYMNHSCEATCLGTPYGFEIAVTDIEPGHELTNDYAVLMHATDEPFVCLCGTPSCRGRISQDDVPIVAERWRTAIAGALRLVDAVAQPLRAFVTPNMLERAQADHATALPV